MARPTSPRTIANLPGVVYFKPAGIPLRDLAERVLSLDELEALRLADKDGLPQLDAAALMGISRQTFSRILGRARQTVAACLTEGTAIRIEGGKVNPAQGQACCAPKTTLDSPGPRLPKK